MASKDVDSKIMDIFAKDDTLFEKVTPAKEIQLTEALNKELPVEECGVELTENEKKVYNLELEWLKNERKKHPGVPISYEIKYSWFD